MAKIVIAKLDPETKHKICHKEFSLKQLECIYTILYKEQKRKQKVFQKTICFTFLIVAILLIITYVYTSKPDILWICFYMLVIMLLFIFILVWFLSIGYLKFQFNHLIQKHYIEYVTILKL